MSNDTKITKQITYIVFINILGDYPRIAAEFTGVK